MSEPKLISPMLDNFTMGEPISEHNGVRCCPAMQNESDNKYIVKIISTPASQAQLDALLLSGAYSSEDAANAYFKTLADGIIDEAKTLERLSLLEGFLPYSNIQIVPMDEGAGFDVYLLSPYKKTLAQHLRHNAMTHLAALNLALDICAALAICRRSGYLYVDLKPENIYMDPDKPSKIGDIGFISLNSLRFASLPERYRSSYTAPEIVDAYASINTTVDVYALGLILYQVFNDGLLPVSDPGDPTNNFPPPAYADYEMAEIILKACNSDPENRWQNPVEMGQAIVSYMQRNGAHDTPIVPVPEVSPEPDSECVELDADTPDDSTDTSDATNEIEVTDGSADSATSCDNTIDYAQAEDAVEENPEDDSTPEITSDENTVAEEFSGFSTKNECVYDEDSDGNLTFLSTIYDETAPEQLDEEITYSELSNEVSDILQQADELISHPAPDPVTPPEPIDVPIPPPLSVTPDEPKADESPEPNLDEQDNDSHSSEANEESVVESEALDTDIIADAPPRKHHWLRNILIALTVIAVAAISVLFYTRYYLQPIDSIILQEHENGDLTVLLSSPVDDSKLTVICSDTYGNQLKRPVVEGRADFTGLAPDSAYTIEVVIDGFHKLTGDTFAAFTTPAITNIMQFRAVTGSEDGSVILTFTIDGPDPAQWQIQYSAEGVETQTTTFAGKMCTITGLTIGQEYKFVLTPETNLNYTGTNELTHIASTITKANDLKITSCLNDTLSAIWTVPENSTVESWSARCYNDSGYDKTLVVNETAVTFDGIDTSDAYTIEVTAAGMSVSERAYAAANSATVTDFKADTSNANKITLSWNSNGYEAEQGWLLMYTADGSATQEISGIKGNSVDLSPKIPGVHYAFTLQAVDGTSVLGGQFELQTPDAKSFSGYGVSTKYMEFEMCKRPSNKNWDRYDLSSSDYTSTFSTGQKASFLVHLKREYNTSKNNITTLYVIRDENGAVVSTSTSTKTWTKMWYRSYCELDIPSLPTVAGKYTITVYFNGALAHSQNFKITA